MTIHYQNQVISNKQIVIDNSHGTVLGPELTFINCDNQLITDARALTLTNARFIECRIKAIKKLKNFRWCNAWIENSNFFGNFEGCDFGYWPEHYSAIGGIKACDFSHAMLDGCRFFGELGNTMEFPDWPCFVVEFPKNSARFLEKKQLPDKLRFWVDALSWAPEEVRIQVEIALAVSKRFGGTEVIIRDLIFQYTQSLRKLS